VDYSQYADDIALWATSVNPIQAASYLQEALGALETYCSQWHIKLNANKTKLVLFANSNRLLSKHRGRPIVVTLYDENIEISKTAKFLGVTFDHRHSFTEHTKILTTTVRRKLNLLKAVSGTRWGADSGTLLQIYKQYVRPSIEYGHVAWCTTTQSNWKSLQRLQNLGLKHCLKLPFYTPTTWVHGLSEVDTLNVRIHKLMSSYISNVRRSGANVLMRDFLDSHTNIVLHANFNTPISFLLANAK
jgi:hypothetical protein